MTFDIIELTSLTGERDQVKQPLDLAGRIELSAADLTALALRLRHRHGCLSNRASAWR